jgi:hypothetical protein
MSTTIPQSPSQKVLGNNFIRRGEEGIAPEIFCMQPKAIAKLQNIEIDINTDNLNYAEPDF